MKYIEGDTQKQLNFLSLLVGEKRQAKSTIPQSHAKNFNAIWLILVETLNNDLNRKNLSTTGSLPVETLKNIRVSYKPDNLTKGASILREDSHADNTRTIED